MCTKTILNVFYQKHLILDEPLENVIRQRKRKNLSRGRRQKRGTADSSAEQGVAESEMVPESSEDEGKENASEYAKDTEALKEEHNARWKRILLLIVAVTVHNIPEGTRKNYQIDYIEKSFVHINFFWVFGNSTLTILIHRFSSWCCIWFCQ